jgi:hypothetical protein
VSSGRPRGEPPPDLELGLSLRARSLRFRTVPKVKAGFDGTPAYDVRTESQRDGLPARVKQGVTYRRVRVRGRATLRVAEQIAKADEDVR